MRVPYRWLKEYVDVGLGPEELAAALTGQGLAVEAVERRGAAFRGVVTGRVLEVAPHPNADRLKVCLVDTGGAEPRQIVCGAPNVAAGQTVPVALPGAELPGGVRIGRARLRGVESDGMICSARELGLPDPTEGAGIMVLPGEHPPGRDLGEALGLDEAVLVLDLTPNYATHCQSLLGVAREVAALTGGAVRVPEVRVVEAPPAAAELVEVAIEDPDLCPRYVARVIEGVRVGPSPEWLQRRLEAAGMRPINNVVDVTNYVMLETGQPLHAFDLARLRAPAGAAAGGRKRIVVRRARPGERLLTLDGVERGLAAEDLVIADGVGPVALAGVMGGADSEIRAETTAVLLESAAFHNLTVRRTARRLGIASEAAARFEKWVDPEGCRAAADRACALLAELAGGVVLEGAVDVYPRPAAPRLVRARPARINALLGTDLPAEEMAGIFRRLGFEVRPEAADGEMTVVIPTRRPDIEGEHDLAEEVARLYGYDRVPVTLPRSPAAPAPLARARRLAEEVRRLCLAAGLHEVMTYSFHDPALFDRLGLPAGDGRRRAIPLANPLTADQGVLRTSLLPLLLEVAATNVRRRQEDVAIFEVGRVYLARSLPLAELPEERLALAALATGRVRPNGWWGTGEEADFFYLKGVAEALLERLGVDEVAFRRAQPPGYHPGRTAEIALVGTGEVLGVVGEVHPQVASAWDLPGRVVALELDAERLFELARPVHAYRPLPRYPAVSRDLAVAVRAEVPAERVRQTIVTAAGPLLESVRLFDLYAGPGVPAGWRSLAYSLVYRAADRTLTDAKVEEVHDRVRRALVEELGAELRS